VRQKRLAEIEAAISSTVVAHVEPPVRIAAACLPSSLLS
jgi:hypothetical protein